MKTKKCPRCKQRKDISEFYSEQSRHDGYAVFCKSCSKADARTLREEAINQYGGPRCTNCGETFFEVLALDHINDDGNEDRKKRGSGQTLLRSLKREGWPKGSIQVLCHNCNVIKRNYPELLSKYKECRVVKKT